MTDRLAQVYERLKLTSDRRKDEDGNSTLLYRDVTAALRASHIPDSEIIGAIRDCLVAHAFVGVSVLQTVGGPQSMEIPVGETESLAKALYYVVKVQESMIEREVMDDLADEEEGVPANAGDKKES